MKASMDAIRAETLLCHHSMLKKLISALLEAVTSEGSTKVPGFEMKC